jgi:hypothetical protein
MISISKKTSHLLFLFTIVFFAILFFSNHTFGALGDDSPGYIFMASKYYRFENPIYKDELVSKLLDKYRNEEIGFALPHFSYKLLSNDGKIAPKPPTGFPFLMSILGHLVGEDKGYYLLNPLFGLFTLVGLYFLIIEIFNKKKYKYLIALMTVGLLGVTNNYFAFTTMEPLREVPSLTLTIFSLLFFLKAIKKERLFYIGISGFLFGWALNVRETAILFILCFPILYIITGKKYKLKQIFKYLTIFILFLIIAYSFTLINNFNSKNEIENVTGELLAANADHLKNIKIKNWWDNQGKFRPGQGGIIIYYEFLKDLSPFPYFILLVLVGLIALIRSNWKIGLFVIVVIIPSYLFFSSWINPYHRYIFTIIPFIILLFVYGLLKIINLLHRTIKSNLFKILLIALTITVLSVGVLPSITKAFSIIRKKELPSSRSVPMNDFKIIKNIKLNDGKNVLICLGNSLYMAAYIEAHTSIRTIKAPKTEIINEIINYLMENGYSIYIWSDKTDSMALSKIKETYQLNLIEKLNFKFNNNNDQQPGNSVELFQLQNKNENFIK